MPYCRLELWFGNIFRPEGHPHGRAQNDEKIAEDFMGKKAARERGVHLLALDGSTMEEAAGNDFATDNASGLFVYDESSALSQTQLRSLRHL